MIKNFFWELDFHLIFKNTKNPHTIKYEGFFYMLITYYSNALYASAVRSSSNSAVSAIFTLIIQPSP